MIEASSAAVDDPPAGSAAAGLDSTKPRRGTIVAILTMLGYQGFTMSINGVGAPWIAKSFGLDQSGIASLYAWIALSAIGALILSRLADKLGRRRLLLWCIAATPVCSFGAGLSTSLLAYALFEIPLYAFIGASVSSSVVMLAEELPIAKRARGQSLGGLAMSLGGGLCVISMPLLDYADLSWRWLLMVSAAGALGVPRMIRMTAESKRWEHAAAEGKTSRGNFYDVFRPEYRDRAVPILICFLFSTVANTSATSWTYYHAVSVVGLSAGAASAMVVIAGGVGLAGFPLGAWGSETLGRVPTVVAASLLAAGGVLWFYWGPPPHSPHPALWLGAGFLWFTLAGNTAVVGGNAAATELFPTALRGTMIGWFSLFGAVGSVAAQAAIAVLAQPLGGLSIVVGYLALLVIPSAIIFGLFIDETRGLSLEVAAREVE